jgi:ArsR family transcriptional regulator, arsenate/arsenite/antimonite-responsive transcriptional repressor
MDLIAIMKALSDENRIRILNLVNKREICVCEMEELLSLTQTNLSRHLSKLKDIKFITSEKRGLYIFYSINRQVLKKHPFISAIINQETLKSKQFITDNKNYDKMAAKGMICPRDGSSSSCCCKK